VKEDPPVARQTTREQRSTAALIAVAIAIALAGASAASLGFRRLFLEAPAPAPEAASPAPPPAPVPSAAVVEVSGAVERSGGDGHWLRLEPGARLSARDEIRTGASGVARLAVGSTSRITVHEGSLVSLRAATPGEHRWRVSRGRLAVDVRSTSREVVVVESPDAAAVARATDASFSVLAGGKTIAVATASGVVSLASAGAAVDVAAGQHATARTGAGPSEPAPLPVDVLLKLARASQPSDGVCIRIEGRADVGAEVAVDGRPVEVGGDGRFAVTVARRRGLAVAHLVVRDAAGRTRRVELPCDLEEDPEIRDFAVRWKHEN
jgi:hypothetical protein